MSDTYSYRPFGATRYASFLLNYLFVWCPRYKAGILDSPQVREVIQEAIEETAEKFGCKIYSLSLLPDRVNLHVSAIPDISPGELIGKFKGASGSRVAARFPELQKRGKIWQRSYHCQTVGGIQAAVVQEFLDREFEKIEE